MTPDMSLIYSILQGGIVAYSIARQKGIKPDHLSGDSVKIYELFESYVPKGRLPSLDEIALLTQIELTEHKSLLDIDACSNLIAKRTLGNQLNDGIAEVVGKIPEDPYSVRDALTKLLVDTAVPKGTTQSTNDVFSIESLEQRYLKAEEAGDKTLGLSSPWPSRDKVSLGLHRGELEIIMAKRSTGKTWAALSWASHVWKNDLKPHEKILIASMEMPPSQITYRLAAIHNKLDYANFRGGKLDQSSRTRFLDWCKMMKTKDDQRPEVIIMGSDEIDTPADLARYAARYKPSLVIVDGFYIMGKKSRKPIWERTLENVQSLKLDVAIDQNVPVIATTQLSGSIGKEELDAEADSAAYAKAIGDYADTVDGLFADETFLAEKKRVMRGMKGRDFEPIDLLINFNLSTQDYSEIKVLNANTEIGTPLALDAIPGLTVEDQIQF